MAEKTVEDIITESKQRTLHNPWITIESAASRIALGRVVKGEEWRENEEIQEMYKALYDEACKIEEHLQTRMKLGDVFEWVKNNDHITKEIITKYPEEKHQELASDLIAAIQRIFYFDVDTYKTFREIYLGLNAEYGVYLVCNETVTDLENIAGYKHPEKNEKTKTARAIFIATLNAIMAEADKFGLVPQFTPDKETKPDFFYFHPVFYKQGASKGCLEVKTEGIKAWLEYNKIHDKYYNLAPEKPDIPTADASEYPPTEKATEARNTDLPLISWTANDADFAELIYALREKGYIEASSTTEALRIASSHFSGVNQNPRTLIQGRSNRSNAGKAGKFDCIPKAEKPKKK